MPFIYANNSSTTLGAALNNSATSLTVATGAGARFPAVVAPDVLLLTITEGNTVEVVWCTAHTLNSDIFTITRAKESIQSGNPVAGTFTTAATVAGNVTKGAMENAQPLRLPVQASNPAAATEVLQLYSKTATGSRAQLKWVGPSGVDQVAQPSVFNNMTALYRPTIGTAVTGGFGFATWTVLGTASHPAPSNAAPLLINSARRTRFTSVATANNGGGLFMPTPMVWGGNSGIGGYYFFARIADASATVVLGQRLFVGLAASTTTMAGADPSTFANTIGFGYDAGDAVSNFQIIRRDATTLNKVALSTVTARTTNQMFDVHIYCPPAGASVSIRVDQIAVATGVSTTVHDATYNTNIPVNTAFLTPHIWKGTGSTAAAQILDIQSIYIESDF